MIRSVAAVSSYSFYSKVLYRANVHIILYNACIRVNVDIILYNPRIRRNVLITLYKTGKSLRKRQR